MRLTGRQLGGLHGGDAHRAAFTAAGIIATRPYRWGPGCPLPRCTATAKSTGKRCRVVARKGKKVCRMHGGGSRPDRPWTPRRLRAREIAEIRKARRAEFRETKAALAADDTVRTPSEQEAFERAVWSAFKRI
jgi:hypothetical protein